MRTIGVYLIFAAVVLRGAVVAADEPYFTAVLGLLAAYGLLLFVETWLTFGLQSLPTLELAAGKVRETPIPLHSDSARRSIFFCNPP
jgi:hypothetical protein